MPALISALQDAEPRVRVAAAGSLGLVRGEQSARAMTALNAALKSSGESTPDEFLVQEALRIATRQLRLQTPSAK